ncbi:MAG: branched-chain amino acid ABC transporter permease [Candidatus Tectomicrobia bacterium]|uniref:Branched-chain amino acid ABC transporter permease n=1 Tax=Tectimicrobiota bacterium TaxID=2528274 RepID=A0A937W212_UNCTE|nr:branched-chain amino acid ABC transporter permease [Candidatus Tectomicrobia bacterium]
MDLTGVLAVLVFTGIFASIYALLSLGLNLQWGCTGLFNVGVAGFYAIGAYTSALLTTPPTSQHVGGWHLPMPIGILGAMLTSGLLAYVAGRPTLRLREDYLAIATISLAETLRLVLKNEAWLTNGVQGLRDIPRPFPQALGSWYDTVYLGMLVGIVALVYVASERLMRSPWGRVLKAIREDEIVAASVGKHVFRFKMQALVLGAMIMGLGGSLYAHYVTFISPDAFHPLMGTFLVWVMLMAGGSGNNRGAILGAVVIWGLWSFSDVLTSTLPAPLDTRASYLRVMLIGFVLQGILLKRPQGLLPEQ